MTEKSESNSPCSSCDGPRILSLDELQIHLSDQVYEYLAEPLRTNNNDEVQQQPSSSSSAADGRLRQPCKALDALLERMKMPPKTTILRLTRTDDDDDDDKRNEREEVLQQVRLAMEEWIASSAACTTNADGHVVPGKSSSMPLPSCHVKLHPLLSDVISIDVILPLPAREQSDHVEQQYDVSSLYARRIPRPQQPVIWNGSKAYSNAPPPFSKEKWPWRKQTGWPCTHKVVIVDRLCGEAVLRGSNIFVRGILVADANIQAGEAVAVYADLGIRNTFSNNDSNKNRATTATTTTRGQQLQHYRGHAVFFGIGTAACSRSEFFSQSQGLGVQMSALPWHRAGPVLPPLAGQSSSSSSSSSSRMMSQLMASGRVHAQNLPSAVVAHVLDPKPGDVIFDMCAAPGGKTSHLAKLVHARATIVMADKSRKKVVQARDLFRRLLGANGSTCITPLHLDSTDCVERRQDVARQSVQEVLLNAKPSTKDGLLQVSRFFPESFDRILLDPPCSALGLRPKLKIPQQTVKELSSLVNYQKRFIREAVDLLRPGGGTMTYSTCTINYHENEGMVRHILDEYPCMQLLPIQINVGHPGLSGGGSLTESERSCLRRFGSTADEDVEDTIGFFLAKFRKRSSSISS